MSQEEQVPEDMPAYLKDEPGATGKFICEGPVTVRHLFYSACIDDQYNEQYLSFAALHDWYGLFETLFFDTFYYFYLDNGVLQ